MDSSIQQNQKYHFLSRVMKHLDNQHLLYTTMIAEEIAARFTGISIIPFHNLCCVQLVASYMAMLAMGT